MVITIDAASGGQPLKPVWAYFGYDEANYTTSDEARDLLRTLAEAHSVPVRTRTHFLFNSGDGAPSLKWGSTNIYTEDENGSPVYDYTIIDEIMDATVDSGVYPIFELGFMPEALTSGTVPYQNSNPYVLDGGAFYPPNDYEKWGELVRTYAEHVRDRYPNAETTWEWELWNEPDIPYFQGTFKEYARLFDYTEAALHDVFPNAPLGGPAIVRPNESFLADFLDHCENGTNAVTGETGTRLDLVTFHAKGGVTLFEDNVRMNLGNQLHLHRLGFETVAASAAFADTPIVMTEADPDGCAACSSDRAIHLDYRNRPAYGAYEVAMMKRSLDLADDVGVDLKGVLTWAFTFPGTPYFAGYRALATNGIHLPVLGAFKFLGQMGGERLAVSSSGSLSMAELLENSVRTAPDIDALASREGDEIRILVWNYHDDLVEVDATRVSLEVTLPEEYEDFVHVTHQRIDDDHGNAFAVWESLGSPREPSEAELAQLRKAMTDFEFATPESLSPDGSAVTLSFDLPRFGLSLVTLTPTTAPPDDGQADPPLDPAGCTCRLSASRAPNGAPELLILIVLTLAAVRRRQHGDLNNNLPTRTKVHHFARTHSSLASRTMWL